jgi:hypothetical protein
MHCSEDWVRRDEGIRLKAMNVLIAGDAGMTGRTFCGSVCPTTRADVIGASLERSSPMRDSDHCAVSCMTIFWHALPVRPPWAMAVFV